MSASRDVVVLTTCARCRACMRGSGAGKTRVSGSMRRRRSAWEPRAPRRALTEKVAPSLLAREVEDPDPFLDFPMAGSPAQSSSSSAVRSPSWESPARAAAADVAVYGPPALQAGQTPQKARCEAAGGA